MEKNTRMEGGGGAARALGCSVSNGLMREGSVSKTTRGRIKKAQDSGQIVDTFPYQLFDPQFVYVLRFRYWKFDIVRSLYIHA